MVLAHKREPYLEPQLSDFRIAVWVGNVQALRSPKGTRQKGGQGKWEVENKLISRLAYENEPTYWSGYRVIPDDVCAQSANVYGN